MALKGHTQANENSCVVAQRRRFFSWCQEPDCSGTREPRGTSNCCYEHEYQTLHNGAPLGGFSCRGCSMETIVRRCAGLDVHKESVVACARVIDDNGELQLSTQTFGTTMSDLLVLGDWLASHGVTLVGMESTGVFWKPVYMLLETEFECWLLNAQHLRNVPGRKTDVADAAWIAQLVAHGLVRPSFVPPKEIRELRELTRYRKALIQERRRRGSTAAQDHRGLRHQDRQRRHRHFGCLR